MLICMLVGTLYILKRTITLQKLQVHLQNYRQCLDDVLQQEVGWLGGVAVRANISPFDWDERPSTLFPNKLAKHCTEHSRPHFA